ncbi:hypothetical protein DH2020_027038 [Rehmannia glutinosa]|uniref:AIPP2-like SPOC-like domain-containing protein n=1 Tax=Rehmannia glutinosa TaxID=99300 RepID=A0ABR0VX52_REHGL
MEKVCEVCGDIGSETALVYCFKCLKAACHRYCMDPMPKSKSQVVYWLCDQCESWPNRSSSKISRQSDDDDHEISSINSKKNQTGDDKSESTKNNFLYSFSCSRGINPFIYAEPLIRSIWTGIFDVFCGESIYQKLGDVYGFLSSKACQKVFNMTAQFQPVLQFEMVPKSYVWPKGFQEAGPTDDNIALYFFPSFVKHENVYDYLVFEMIRDDLAMRAFVQNVELLIFTSIVLPSRFWRFQGKLYLWGVFRGKQAPLDM